MGATYRRLMFQKAGELSKRYGGLRNIPAKLLEESGIGLAVKGETATVIINFPSPDIMERKIAEARSGEQPIAKQVEGFKPDPEPTPIQFKAEVTMDDFWVEQGWYKIDKKGWRLTRAKWKDDEQLQREAIVFLVERVLQIDPRDVTRDDFRDNRLGGLISEYYSGSPYKAVSEAFPELDIREWEMLKTSSSFYKKKGNRISAIKWLVEKLDKDPKDITVEDFHSNRVRGLLSNHYSNSPYQAISEAFPELDIREWEMSSAPKKFYEDKENRITAVRWLVERLGKDPREVTADDFRDNGLGGLMTNYYFGPYRALREAGLVTEEDRRYIRGRGGRISKPNPKP